MAGESTSIAGLEDALMAMRALPRKLRIGAIRRGLRGAAREIQTQAKLTAPVLRKSTPRRIKGLVRRSIVVRASAIAARRGDVGVFVTVKRSKAARARGAFSVIGSKRTERPNDPFYFRFLEDGTRKMAPRSFIGPALQTRRAAALQAFDRELRQAIAIEAGRR